MHTEIVTVFLKDQANKQSQLIPKNIFCSQLNLTIPVTEIFAKYMYMNRHNHINVFQVPV